MARYTCENLRANFESSRRHLVTENAPPGLQPTQDDLRLVERWFKDMDQSNLDRPDRIDTTASVILFAARAKGELKEEDIGVILNAQRQVMIEQFSKTIVECGRASPIWP